MSARTRQLIPWISGAAIIAFVFWRVPATEMLAAFRIARLESYLPLMLGACLAWFLIDSAALGTLFTRFNTPLGSREARELRGLAYLLTPIHWNVGRAAIIARMHRTHDVPVLEATSSMAFLQTLDAILLSALAWAGLSQLETTAATEALRLLVSAFGLLLTGYLVLLRSSIFDAGNTGLVARFRRLRIHRTHRIAKRRDIVDLLLLRLAYYAVFVGVYSWGLGAFGVEVPFALVIASVPIIQGIGALPLSPAGLGTQQAAMLYFFSGHGPDPAILAFGFSLPLVSIVIRSLIGWPYLGRLTRPSPARPSALGVGSK